jgi:hypothetical protein
MFNTKLVKPLRTMDDGVDDGDDETTEQKSGRKPGSKKKRQFEHALMSFEVLDDAMPLLNAVDGETPMSSKVTREPIKLLPKPSWWTTSQQKRKSSGNCGEELIDVDGESLGLRSDYEVL